MLGFLGREKDMETREAELMDVEISLARRPRWLEGRGGTLNSQDLPDGECHARDLVHNDVHW